MGELDNQMSRWELNEHMGDMPTGGFRRRHFTSVVVAGLSATMLLSACGGDDGTGDDATGGEGPVELRIGVWSYIPDVIDLDKIVSDYEAENPDVTIDVSVLSTDITTADSFVQKFTLEARQEEASYDLIFGATPWIEVAPLAEAGALAPLDDLVDEEVLNDLLGPAREGVTFEDGNIYSLPTWTDVVGLIYRSDLLEEHGGSPQPPGTWDDVVSVAEQLEQELPDGTSAYGADWNFMHRSFLPIFVTLADQPFTEEGIVNMDDPAAVETLELIHQLQPFMPPNADQDLGTSETFQAGNVVMETYWQAQRTRAVTAGLDENVVKMGSNPQGNRDSTLFWTTDAIVPAHAANKEQAVQFWVDGMLRSEDALQASVDEAGKIPPYSSALEQVTMPEFMQPLAEQLATGTPIPMTDAFLSFEQPAYKEQVERMILEGQSPQDTAANLKEEFEKDGES